MPKYYLQPIAPEKNYIGIQYRRRLYNLLDKTQITTSDYTAHFGLQIYLNNFMMLDYNLGIGYRYKTPTKKLEKAHQMIVPISLKLSLIF